MGDELHKCSKCCCDDGPIPSDRVYYSGQFLPTLGIAAGESLTNVLIAIDTFLGGFSPPTFDKIIGGNATATGDGIKKEFIFNHNLGKVPTAVVVNPKTKEASEVYTTTFDATTIKISYSVAPSQGDPLSWMWVAIKNK